MHVDATLPVQFSGPRESCAAKFDAQVFVVEDRMHRRFSDRVDIWMETKREAIIFGKVMAEIEIIEEEA